jgi:predicted lipoprotein with Yx(FWY)xxD motif
MTQTRPIRTRTGATVVAVGVAALVAACGSSGHANSSGSASGTPASDHTVQISIVSGKDGRYLAGAGGRAIYLWVADAHDTSHCTSGACAKFWPAVLTKSKATTGSGVKGSDLGTISHSGGERQVTYNGHPLYYFAEDKSRGVTRGQGSNAFGAKWWLVSPSGAAITHSGSSGGSGSGSSGTPATTTSSSSSAAGGWG